MPEPIDLARRWTNRAGLNYGDRCSGSSKSRARDARTQWVGTS